MYKDKSYENIKQNILAEIIDVDKREGSFIDEMISPLSLELESNYNEFDKMLGVMFLTDSTGEYLEKRGLEYGIARKMGTFAKGEVIFQGTDGSEILKGCLIASSTGLMFETIENAKIIGTSATVKIISQGIGGKYNCTENTITQMPVSIVGITAVSNIKASQGGTDTETDDELLNRILFKIQNPATSGNKNHYKIWATEVDGIGDAKIFPLYKGNGTVGIMPITYNKRKPDSLLLSKVFDHIESERPIGTTIYVEPPIEVIVDISAVLVIETGSILAEIKKKYTELLNKYIIDSVFKIATVDYFKCLSIMYEIAGIKQVTDFKINNSTSNIFLQPTQIQIVGNIALSV
ncbi:MAG: baseplate J/gp47 family protein [Oscillospiraceae bacterium]